MTTPMTTCSHGNGPECPDCLAISLRIDAALTAAQVRRLVSPVNVDIVLERQRQNAKWGVQRHSWPEWMTVLGEEYGEACQAALRLRFGEDNDQRDRYLSRLEHLRTELVQIAAVAVAIIEHIDEVIGETK